MKSNASRRDLTRLTSRLETRGVHLVALLTAVMGLVNLFSAVIPALHPRLILLENFIPLEIQHGTRLASALAGFALLVLAGSLSRRKHLAWLMTVIVLAISIVTHLFKGLDYEEASLAAVLILLLVFLRRDFHAFSDPPSVRQGLLTLLEALFFTCLYGVAGLFLLDRHFNLSFDLWSAFKQTVVMFTTFSNPGVQYTTRFGRYFLDSIYIVGGSTLAYALLMLIRPVLVRLPASSADRQEARRIVEAFGHTALARPALFDDKSYYFSPGGSCIAYACRAGGAIALTDPIGPQQDAADAIQGFQQLCTRNGWQPAFSSVLPDYLPLYHQAGLNSLCVSNEAIVELRTFSLEGSANKKLRNAVTKITRLGYTSRVVLPPHDAHLLSRLRAISDEWLTLKSGGEMRFAMGWFDEKYLDECPLMLVEDPAGELCAFANLVGEYQADEITLDLMRHHRRLENGVMEFMFAGMLSWAREQGYSRFSLGQSALSRVGEKPDDPRLEKFLHYIYENFNRFYNFKGLHSFKEKFNPIWEPRYIIYPGLSSLPALLTAFIRVNSGDDFLWRYFKR
jgi:phosphatidylglycerol lysyltransferase